MTKPLAVVYACNTFQSLRYKYWIQVTAETLQTKPYFVIYTSVDAQYKQTHSILGKLGNIKRRAFSGREAWMLQIAFTQTNPSLPLYNYNRTSRFKYPLPDHVRKICHTHYHLSHAWKHFETIATFQGINLLPFSVELEVQHSTLCCSFNLCYQLSYEHG